MMNTRTACVLLVTLSISGAVTSCKTTPTSKKGNEATSSSQPGASTQKTTASVAPTASHVPIALDVLENTLNPGHKKPYAGPTGAVEGVIRIEGDPPPYTKLRFTYECAKAARMYGKLFRKAEDGTVADVLVAVTEYGNVYLPAKEKFKKVEIRDCAYDTRTVGMTFGQFIKVFNLDDRRSYVPYLQGAHAPAMMVAVPKGDPVKLYPTEVGHYLLADSMKRDWMKADVFVVKYPTIDVTGTDGRFHISGIPVGKVKLSALLPAIKSTAETYVTIEKDKTTRQDLTLKFEAEKMPKAPKPNKRPIIR